MFVEAILEALPELLFGDSFLALTGSKMVSDMSFCTGRASFHDSRRGKPRQHIQLWAFWA